MNFNQDRPSFCGTLGQAACAEWTGAEWQFGGVPTCLNACIRCSGPLVKGNGRGSCNCSKLQQVSVCAHMGSDAAPPLRVDAILTMEGQHSSRLSRASQRRSGYFSGCMREVGRSGGIKEAGCLPGSPWEFYDMTAVRVEKNNLAQHSEVVKNMAAKWMDWAGRCNLRV